MFVISPSVSAQWHLPWLPLLCLRIEWIEIKTEKEKCCVDFCTEFRIKEQERIESGTISPKTSGTLLLSLFLQKPTEDISLLRIFQLSHIVLHSYQSVQCVCVCVHILHSYAWTLFFILFLTFSVWMYIMCVCLFSALNRRVVALQISIIIIIITWHDTCSVLNHVAQHVQCAELYDTMRVACWITWHDTCSVLNHVTQHMQCAELHDTTHAMCWIMWHNTCSVLNHDTTHGVCWIVWHNICNVLNHVTTHTVCWIVWHYTCNVLNRVTQHVHRAESCDNTCSVLNCTTLHVPCAESCDTMRAVCWTMCHNTSSVLNHMAHVQCDESHDTTHAVCWIRWHGTCSVLNRMTQHMHVLNHMTQHAACVQVSWCKWQRCCWLCRK